MQRAQQLPHGAGAPRLGTGFSPARIHGLGAGVRQSIALRAALLCALCDGIWPLAAGLGHPACCAAQAAREGRLPAGGNARRKACVCCKLNKAPPFAASGSRA